MLAAAALVAALVPPPLTVFCAAGIRGPVEAAAQAWTLETGQQIHLQYGGSGTLLSTMRIAPRGDLYVAASDGYMEQARERGIVAERIPLATQRLVVAVPELNPANITSLEDVLDGRARVALPNPDAAAAGRTCRRVLQEAGVWERLQRSVIVTKPTVSDVAADVRLGTVDAAITWDSTTHLVPGLLAVGDSIFDPSVEQVSIGVLKASKQPTAALQFARYLASRDKGAPLLKAGGLRPVHGDVWQATPRLTLFAGGMLRPALEPIITAFCDREGVRIDRSYNGCGVLVAQIRAGATPDAYAACDQSFLDMVQDQFTPGTLLSRNTLVLLVPKGNPALLQSARDLSRPGLKIGIASPQRSALGALTVSALKDAGLYQSLRSSGNLVVESATGDFLVNQIRVGGLDGAIVYQSNAMASKAVRDTTDVIDPGLVAKPARQPWSIRRNSDHARTLGRLLEAIVAARDAGAFAELGFLPPQAEAP
jgi:molybdenum ABC transporter molybdate-binding protein